MAGDPILRVTNARLYPTPRHGSETYDLVAHEATGEERHRIWEDQKRFNPGFAEYEDKTSRQIPVIVLEPEAE